jgi:non-heme chloroperoxidase
MHLRNFSLRVGAGILDVGEAGNPQGWPVILIPGLSDSWRSYLPLMAALPADLRLIAVSLRGHGDSTKSPTGYRLVDLANDIVAVMQGLGIARASVVGHSLGSTVAQKVAEIAPTRVANLALIGAFVRMGANPAVSGLWTEAIHPLTDPVDPAFVREFQEGAVGPETAQSVIESAITESLKLTAADWKWALAAAMAEDLIHALHDYAGPVLVLYGAGDAYSLADEQVALCRAARRRLVHRRDLGHSPHWEQPAEVAATLADFVGLDTGHVPITTCEGPAHL